MGRYHLSMSSLDGKMCLQIYNVRGDSSDFNIVTNARLRSRWLGSSPLCNSTCQKVCEPATNEHKGHEASTGTLCELKALDISSMNEAKGAIEPMGASGFAEVPRMETRVGTYFQFAA